MTRHRTIHVLLALTFSAILASCVTLKPEDRYPTNQPMLGKYYNKRQATDAEWAAARSQAQSLSATYGTDAVDKALALALDKLYSDPAESVQYINYAYLLEESSPKVYWYYAIWVAANGRGSDPMDLFEKALALNAEQKALSVRELGTLYADIGTYYFHKGSSILRQGRQNVAYLTDAGAEETSLRYYEKAAEIDPKNGRTYEAWSSPLYMLGHFEEALRKLMKAKELGIRIDELHYTHIYTQYARARDGK